MDNFTFLHIESTSFKGKRRCQLRPKQVSSENCLSDSYWIPCHAKVSWFLLVSAGNTRKSSDDIQTPSWVRRRLKISWKYRPEVSETYLPRSAADISPQLNTDTQHTGCTNYVLHNEERDIMACQIGMTENVIIIIQFNPIIYLFLKYENFQDAGKVYSEGRTVPLKLIGLYKGLISFLLWQMQAIWKRSPRLTRTTSHIRCVYSRVFN